MDGFLQNSRVYGYNIDYPTISDDSKTLSKEPASGSCPVNTSKDSGHPLTSNCPLTSNPSLPSYRPLTSDCPLTFDRPTNVRLPPHFRSSLHIQSSKLGYPTQPCNHHWLLQGPSPKNPSNEFVQGTVPRKCPRNCSKEPFQGPCPNIWSKGTHLFLWSHTKCEDFVFFFMVALLIR